MSEGTHAYFFPKKRENKMSNTIDYAKRLDSSIANCKWKKIFLSVIAAVMR